jgi:hypothetical protein
MVVMIVPYAAFFSVIFLAFSKASSMPPTM